MIGKCALVIDDDPTNKAVLGTLLQKQGVACLSFASTGDLSGLVSQAKQVDVVFVDLTLHIRDGYQVLAAFRSAFPNIPVVACTTHTSEMTTARACGFDGFLGKPLDSKKFPGQLARILSRQGVWEIR